MARRQWPNIMACKHFLSWERFILAGILSVGAWARLSGLELGWFILDQARDALEAIEIAEGQRFPLVGPVAQGLYSLGPLYYYLLAIPFWFSKDPSVAVIFLSLLNLLTVYLTYRFGKSFFNERVGLIATALYASFPMAVIGSKTLWNPGFIPFFGILFFYALFRFLVGNSPWGLVGALVALGCSLQIHLTAFALGLLLFIGCILLRPSFPLKHLILGLLLFLALYAPFIVFEVGQGFEGLRQMLGTARMNQVASSDISASYLSWKALTAPFLIPEELLPQWVGRMRGFFAVLQRVELVLFIGGFLYLIWLVLWNRRMGKAWKAHALLSMWVLLPLLTVVHIRVNWLPWYYFDSLYPSQFLVIGIAFSSLACPPRWPAWFSFATLRSACWLGYLTLALIVLAQGFFLCSFYQSIVIGGQIHLTPRQLLGIDEPLSSLLKEEGIETMPAKYKKALTERMLNEFRVDRETFEQSIHGTSFEDLREDKGFFFYMLSKQSGGKLRSGPGWHYLVLRKDLFHEDLSQGRTVNLGPFQIVQYQPLIRPQAWKYTPHPSHGWHAEDFDDATWNSVRLPRRGQHELFKYVITPFYTWEASSLSLRGWVDPPPVGKRLKIVVGLRTAFLVPVSSGRLYLNGTEVDASRLISYHTQFGRTLARVFDVTEALRAEPNLLALHISAGTSTFDLDIYELLLD